MPGLRVGAASVLVLGSLLGVPCAAHTTPRACAGSWGGARAEQPDLAASPRGDAHRGPCPIQEVAMRTVKQSSVVREAENGEEEEDGADFGEEDLFHQQVQAVDTHRVAWRLAAGSPASGPSWPSLVLGTRATAPQLQLWPWGSAPRPQGLAGVWTSGWRAVLRADCILRRLWFSPEGPCCGSGARCQNKMRHTSEQRQGRHGWFWNQDGGG